MGKCCGFCISGRQHHRQSGSAHPGHVLDLMLAALTLSGAATTIAPADYMAIGVAAIGSVIGGLFAARMFRDTDETVEWMWGVSTLAGVAFSPALFDYLSSPILNVDGNVLRAEVIPRTASTMLALSTVVSMSAWGSLRIVYGYILKRLRAFLSVEKKKKDGP